MWVTLRKQPAGWHAGLLGADAATRAAIRRITNAF